MWKIASAQSDSRIFCVYSAYLQKGGFVAGTKDELATIFSDQTIIRSYLLELGTFWAT